VVVKITFRVEIHQNNIFFILKKILLKSAHQNDSKHIKKLKFLKIQVQPHFQTLTKKVEETLFKDSIH
jgi:hypothetical protein